MDPTSLPNHSGSMGCSLIIIYLVANIHLQANTYHLYLSGAGLSQDGFFLVPFICWKFCDAI